MPATLWGIATFVRAPQPKNALSPMPVTPSGIVTSVKLAQSENAFAGMASVQPNSMSYPDPPPAGPAVLSPPQLPKTEFPILVTLPGIVTFSRASQP